MIVHQIFAQIYEEKVQNIIVCENYTMANWLAQQAYGEDAFAVECTQFACTIGDTYKNGVFYRVIDGQNTIIYKTPTAEDEVTILQLALIQLYEGEV